MAKAEAAPARRLERLGTRPKLAEEVLHTLRQALLSGVYPPGKKLGLEELASDLGVSMMPVRESLIALANEGLVIAEPRRGFRANPLQQQDLDDLFEVQAHLAGILAARAARISTSDDIEKLRTTHRSLEALSDKAHTAANLRRIGLLNAEFHRQINKLPAGDRIRWFLRLTTKFIREDLFESVPEMIGASLEDHPRIIDALEKHDEVAARRLMEAHFSKGARLLGCLIVAA